MKKSMLIAAAAFLLVPAVSFAQHTPHWNQIEAASTQMSNAIHVKTKKQIKEKRFQASNEKNKQKLEALAQSYQKEAFAKELSGIVNSFEKVTSISGLVFNTTFDAEISNIVVNLKAVKARNQEVADKVEFLLTTSHYRYKYNPYMFVKKSKWISWQEAQQNQTDKISLNMHSAG